MKGDKENNDNDCFLHKSLKLLGKKWVVFVLGEFIREGKLRFSDLKKALPKITPRALSILVKELSEENILAKVEKKTQKKKRRNGKDEKVEIIYKLTQKGDKLIPILKSFESWNKKFNKCNPKTSCFICKYKTYN
jgi:DNA-binding HxlR family transcriptional regulator